MTKTCLIGWREFRQRVRSRGFLLGSIGTPLIFLVIWAMTGLGEAGAANDVGPVQARLAIPDKPIGYVDLAGLVTAVPDAIPAGLFRAMANVEAAEASLLEGEIDTYYLILPDYRETGRVRRVGPELPVGPPDDVEWFDELLVTNLVLDAGTELETRLLRPFGQTGLEFVDIRPEATETNSPAGSIFPFFVVIAILIPLFTSGSYLFQSLIQEKESRIMEILLVSVRPYQLLTGKLLGLGALTLVQYVIWAGIGLLILWLTGRPVSSLFAGIHLSGAELLLVFPYALGGFLLYAALMAGIGALAPDIDNSRAWTFIITLPMLIPIYLWLAIVNSPHSSLAVSLSLIPFSAPVAMLLRMTSTAVPGWQLGLSLVLLALAAAGLIWLMARLFRAQILLSGEALSLRRLWLALRAGS